MLQLYLKGRMKFEESTLPLQQKIVIKASVEKTISDLFLENYRYEWNAFSGVYNSMTQANSLFFHITRVDLRMMTWDEFLHFSVTEQEEYLNLPGYMHVLSALLSYIRLLVTTKRRLVSPIFGSDVTDHEVFRTRGNRTQLKMVKQFLANNALYDDGIAESLLEAQAELLQNDKRGGYKSRKDLEAMLEELLEMGNVLDERVAEMDGVEDDFFNLSLEQKMMSKTYLYEMKEVLYCISFVIRELDGVSLLTPSTFHPYNGFTKMFHERWANIHQLHFSPRFLDREMFEKVLMVLHLQFVSKSVFSLIAGDVVQKLILMPMVRSEIDNIYAMPKAYRGFADAVTAKYGSIGEVLTMTAARNDAVVNFNELLLDSNEGERNDDVMVLSDDDEGVIDLVSDEE